MLLKELTELNGVSGNEEGVREYIRNKIEGKVDSIRVDSIGNMIAFKKGKSSKYKVMLSAHMDEVGFMVTGYNESGMLKFKPVGGIDERILPGKRVLIGDKKLPGVIGCKPIHLQERSERTENIKLKGMYIDFGADKKDEAEKHVPLGEFITFNSEYVELEGNTVKAKALDDRVGCAVLMGLIDDNTSYEFDLYFCFTVQEEVGLRGAEVAANFVNPDMAFIIEGTTCSDVPGTEKHEHSTTLGGGPALTIMDRTAYADKALVKFIYDSAKNNNIKIQYKQTTTGGNDAGKIQQSLGGVKVASISVPVRYIHSPVSVMSMNDFYDLSKVVKLVLNELSIKPDTLMNLINGGKTNV